MLIINLYKIYKISKKIEIVLFFLLFSIEYIFLNWYNIFSGKKIKHILTKEGR